MNDYRMTKFLNTLNAAETKYKCKQYTIATLLEIIEIFQYDPH